VSFHRSISLGSYSSLKSQVVGNFGQNFRLLKKTTLYGKIFKILYRRIHLLTDPRLVSKFREIWPTGSRWNRALLTWLTHTHKISPRCLALASARIAPKINQGQQQIMYLECPKLYPNRFRVIAELVNTVKTHHKVNPILGWSYIASSRVNIMACPLLWAAIITRTKYNSLCLSLYSDTRASVIRWHSIYMLCRITALTGTWTASRV